MTVADAPGPLRLMSAGAFYQADCAYLLNRLEGAMAYPEQHIPIMFDRIDDTTYEGVLHLDAMVDEDYFGNGLCRWRMVSFGATFRATGSAYETSFIPTLMLDDVTSGRPVTVHFWTMAYPREKGLDGYRDFGEKSPTKFRPDLRDELFDITLVPKEAGQ